LGLPSPSGGTNDEGTFALSVADRRIGTEKFEIRSSRDKIEARAESHLLIEQEGKVLEFRTFPHLVMNNRWEPQSYRWEQKGPQNSRLEIDFRRSPVKVHYRTVTGEDDLRDFELPKDVVVVDTNVLHHFQLLIARCSLSGGEKRVLQAFVPQEALPGVLTIEHLGRESLTIAGRTATLEHLAVTTELAQIELWADKQGRIERISIPAVQLEATRQR